MSIEWCKKPDEGLPAADIVLFLNISPEQAKLRGCYGEERYEKQLFQQQVLENFQQLKTSKWNVSIWYHVMSGDAAYMIHRL